ncbi:MAG TPA: NUDIX domain-containing protein [Balneolales bacterium]|nr:NUDIX domain-containing protein [Balneolales bacterium]
MSRRDIIPVDAAGGLIYRQVDSEAPEVVMIYRWGKWDLPKGKREKDESIADCAAREVSEELGIKRPNIVHELARSYHEYERGGKMWGKTVYWYIMTSDEHSFHPMAEEDIEDARWIPIDEAIENVGYDTLRPVLQKMKDWLANSNSYQ